MLDFQMSTLFQNERGVSKYYSVTPLTWLTPWQEIQKMLKRIPQEVIWRGSGKETRKLPPKTKIKSPQPASLLSILKSTERKIIIIIKLATIHLPSFQTNTKPGCWGAGIRPCTHLGNFIQQFVVFLSFLKSAQIAAHSKKQRERANLLISPDLKGKWTERESPSRLDYCFSSVTSAQKHRQTAVSWKHKPGWCVAACSSSRSLSILHSRIHTQSFQSVHGNTPPVSASVHMTTQIPAHEY